MITSDESDVCDEAWSPLGAGCHDDVGARDQPLESPDSRLSWRGWVQRIEYT